MSDNSYISLLRQAKYHLDMLNDDERLFINAHLKGTNLPKYSKAEARAGFRLSLLSLSDENIEGKDTYQGLIDKFDTWSDDVWNAIKLLYPLPLRSAYGDSETEEFDIDFDDEQS